jgi:hypothetical protein
LANSAPWREPFRANFIAALTLLFPNHRSSFRIHRFPEFPVISRVKNTQNGNTTLKYAIFPTILTNSTF